MAGSKLAVGSRTNFALSDMGLNSWAVALRDGVGYFCDISEGVDIGILVEPTSGVEHAVAGGLADAFRIAARTWGGTITFLSEMESPGL
jgi:hypothetical protein